MLAVPILTPVTMPVAAPTVALAALLLVHVPPPGEDVSEVDVPIHALSVPPIAPAAAATVTTRVAAQPRRM